VWKEERGLSRKIGVIGYLSRKKRDPYIGRLGTRGCVGRREKSEYDLRRNLCATYLRSLMVRRRRRRRKSDGVIRMRNMEILPEDPYLSHN
jgi:hypothetical protein